MFSHRTTFVQLTLLAGLVTMFSMGSVHAVNYTCPVYTHTDTVSVAPYGHPVIVSTGNFSAGVSTGHMYRDFITLGNTYRFRQSGTATSVRLFFQNEYGYASGVYIKVWRRVGATYNLIATSENILSSLGTTGGIYDVTFAQPLTGIQEGDYYGYRLEADYPAVIADRYFLAAQLVGGGEAATEFVDQSMIGSSFAWVTDPLSQSNASSVPMEFTMSNPDVVFVGDSIIAGHPAHYSFLETLSQTNLASTISYNFGGLTSYVTQNMGIGGQTTTQIAARFLNVLAQKPRVVVIEGGVNDIALGGSLMTFTGNMTNMLAAAQADPAVQKIIVLGILPWTNGTNGQNTTVDTRNAALYGLTLSYAKAEYISAASIVGQYRTGGTTGNFWNIKPIYNADGVHFNASGAAAIARVIQQAACISTPPTWTFPANNSYIHSGSILATGTAAPGDLVTVKNDVGAIVGTGMTNGSGIWTMIVTGLDVGSFDGIAVNQLSYTATDAYSVPPMIVSLTMHVLFGQGYLTAPTIPTTGSGSPTGPVGFAGGGGGAYAGPSTPSSTGVIITPITPVVTPIMYPLPPSVTTELEDVYTWGKMHTIISDATFEKTDFLRDLTRLELARLMVAYEKNIAGNTIAQDSACDITAYSDYADIPTDMRQVVRDACSLGIMGWQNDKQHLLPAFRPNKIVTRAQLSAVLARYIYGDTFIGDMSTEWYVPYLTALHNDGIMNRIDQPDMVERRGYVITMLQRLSQK